MDIDQLVLKSQSVVADLSNQVNKLILNEIEVPSFKDVNNRSILYSKYGELIELNSKITNLIIESSSLQFQFKEFISALPKANIPYTLKKTYKESIDKEVEKLKDLSSMLKDYKDSVEPALRFYNSVQYILASPRLMGMD